MVEEKSIGFIENGIVIDHLSPKSVWKIVKLLKVEEDDLGRISLGDNYTSSKIGKKSFIKIEGRKILEKEINLVALVCPDASISIIENGKVIVKKKAVIPEFMEDILCCGNVNCISNDEKEKVKSKIFYKEGKFKCYYCSSSFGKDEVRTKK